MTSKVNICLSMIVKNEAHCIQKCLESVKPYITSWVICDTGSTDDTEEVIKKTLKGISGEFHKHEWEDFATNRNLSLELARKKLGKKSGYILFIDADDQLVVTNPQIFNSLTHSIYRFNLHHGPIIYNRIELVRKDIPAKYVGVCHEYLEIAHEHDGPILDGCHII
jgi:glycosyltransferase involved in cell wall biosynthesis